jgi:acetoin utilization deacetylase AcuC-like enzyme
VESFHRKLSAENKSPEPTLGVATLSPRTRAARTEVRGVIGDRTVLAFYDERMLSHRPDLQDPFLPTRLERRIREILQGLDVKWRYPEHPGRLTTIRDLLDREPVAGVTFETGAKVTHDQLARVHTTAYLRDIYDLRGKSAWVDRDTTAVSPGSIDAAEVAAGTAIAAVEAVMSRRAESAFAIVRPPGHHAEPARARGFCLFNNTAAAAAHAQAELGCERVLIVDWDVHHGNGTQTTFYTDPDVMLFDTHRAAPFYPGSGSLTEVGAGPGEGTTVNVPLPSGAGDIAIVQAFREILVPAADWFQPDLVLVSAGFDGHRLDLALNVSTEGFAAMTAVVQEVADRHCDGRLALILEGGYHLESLPQSVRAVLETLAGASPPTLEDPGLQEVLTATEFHRSAFDDS